MNFPILSSLILLPIVGALFLFFTKDKEGNNLTAKYVALFTTVVNFLISIYLWISFDQSTSSFQFVEDRVWIEGFINYKVGVDGISILFIILTTFITPICIISVNNSVKNRLRDFLIAIKKSLNLFLTELFTDIIQMGVINVVKIINKIEIPSTPTL